MKFVLLLSFVFFSPVFIMGQSANLHLAAVNGDLDEIRSLIQNGADVDGTMSSGWTPLMICAKYGKLKVMEELINAKINLTNAEGNSALIVAVIANQIEAVKTLLAANVNTSQKNRRGKDAVEVARIMGYSEILILLENHRENAPEKSSAPLKGDKTG